MGLLTTNSGFKTKNVVSSAVIFGGLIRVYGVDFTSATKQVLWEVASGLQIYIQSGRIYIENFAGKGETNGLWYTDVTSSGYVDNIYIIYWPLNTSSNPNIFFNGVSKTVTRQTAPSAVTQITLKQHYFGCDSSGANRLNGSIEEIAYFRQGLGIQPTANQVISMTKSNKRGMPLRIDGLEYYFGCNEVPEGDIAMGYERIKPDADLNTNWTPSSGNRWECISDDAGSSSDYIYANDSQDGQTYVANLGDATIYEFATGIRMISDVVSDDGLSFSTKISIGFAAPILTQSHTNTIRQTKVAYLQQDLTQTQVNGLWYSCTAAATIGKSEEGGRVYAGNVDVLYNKYRLKNKNVGNYSVANELIGHAGNSIGNVLGTIDKLN